MARANCAVEDDTAERSRSGSYRQNASSDMTSSDSHAGMMADPPRDVCGDKNPLYWSLVLVFVVVFTIAVTPKTTELVLSNLDMAQVGVAEQADEVHEQEFGKVEATSPTAMEQEFDQNSSHSVWNGNDGLDVLHAFRLWDSSVGCVQFKKRLKDDPGLQQNSSTFESLQRAENWTCTELQIPHVTVFVTSALWIPDTLDGMRSCSCGITCLWTKSPVLGDSYDVHFHEGLDGLPAQRTQGEPLRASIDMEANRPRSNREDIFVSYHARAEVQATYVSLSLQANKNHLISHKKRTDVLVYWSSSHCLNDRQIIASTFLTQISHHSFGNCLNNVGRLPRPAEEPIFQMYPWCKTGSDDPYFWFYHLHCAMSHYMFVLAIENTIAESYVSEKLFYALDAGAVPIYFGAPNVLDLVPPHSIIRGSDFDSMEALAAFVKGVAADPVRYAEYHAWRRCGELGNYRHTCAVSLETMPCRVCATASKLGGRNAPSPPVP